MEFIHSKQVENIIADYPPIAQKKLNELRLLIINSAKENDTSKLVETTKWGEPSYVSKNGSTIRMDWKKQHPERVSLYFICSTELVSTFKLIFGEELIFEKNRAIHLDIDEPIPEQALRRCIILSLNYHKIKHLPLLGE